MQKNLLLIIFIAISSAFVPISGIQALPDPASVITGSTVFTADTAPVYQSMPNNAIIGLKIEVLGPGSDLSVTALSIDASLCTNFGLDVLTVKVYYTGNDSTFSPNNLYWSGIDVSQPLTGNQPLMPGKNYFWICYDITNYAVVNDTLDALCNSFTINEDAGIFLPDITSPEGYRLVQSYIIIPRKISGKLQYDNAAKTGLSDVMLLLNDGYTQQQVFTNNTGYYQFVNLLPGTYYILVMCNKPWGGVNAVDGLTILRHFVGLAPLTGLSLLASDVDNNGYTNSADALQVLTRFTGIISSFMAGDWVFEQVVVVIDGTHNVTRNILGLCVGDVNKTYVPY